MFKEMRRKDRQINDETVLKEILINGQYGILSTMGDDGYPYGVPINYVYLNKSIYFHCARDGYKLQNIERSPKVSFCVVSDAKVLPDKFSTKYKSVIVFGIVSEIADESKENILVELVNKYSHDFINEGKKYIDNTKDITKLMKIDIQHVTGKAGN